MNDSFIRGFFCGIGSIFAINVIVWAVLLWKLFRKED